MRKKIGAIILSAMILLGHGGQSEAAGVVYLQNVTQQMTQPIFWNQVQDTNAAAGLLENTSDQVLADAATIQAINAAIMQTPECHRYALESIPAEINVTATVADILQTASEGLQKYMQGGYYDKNGNVVTADFFAPIMANMVDPEVNDLTTPVIRNIQYGICTTRSNVFCWPSTESVVAGTPSDYNYLSSIRANDPVVIKSLSKDGAYYRVTTSSIEGWVPVNAIAVCSSKEQWLSGWRIAEGRKLVVTAPRIYLTDENVVSSAEIVGKELTMGAELEIRGDEVLSYEQGYPVWLPVRREDGSYEKVEAQLLPSQGVSVGYLPLTTANIVSLALSCLGDVYGWGGMFDAEDCSGYTRNIYNCFGLDLPRNTTWQAASPVRSFDLSQFPKDDVGAAAKLQLLDNLPLGSLLYMKGHVVMYLGSTQGMHYVISAAGSVNYTKSARVNVRSVVINTLEGTTWLNGIYRAIVPYRQA